MSPLDSRETRAVASSAGEAKVSAGIQKPIEKKSKKRKKRIRGEKPRSHIVLRQDEKPAEVRIGRGRVRELDVAPKSNHESAIPRRMRNLFAAKAALEEKAAAKTSQRHADQQPISRRNNLKVVTRTDPAQKMTARQVVVDAVRKSSHQYEKKKAYYKRREERAAARKERRKRRRRAGSDSESEDASDAIGDDDLVVRGKNQFGKPAVTFSDGPRFGEQAQAPPKLDMSFKKVKK